jgi:hypothetical protein
MIFCIAENRTLFNNLVCGSTSVWEEQRFVPQ